jgi:hypothetical protein
MTLEGLDAAGQSPFMRGVVARLRSTQADHALNLTEAGDYN